MEGIVEGSGHLKKKELVLMEELSNDPKVGDMLLEDNFKVHFHFIIAQNIDINFLEVLLVLRDDSNFKVDIRELEDHHYQVVHLWEFVIKLEEVLNSWEYAFAPVKIMVRARSGEWIKVISVIDT